MTTFPVFLALAFCFCAAIMIFEAIKQIEDETGNFPLFFLMACIIIFLALAIVFMPASGEPATKIDPGTYKVVSVYEAGPNVNLGLEIEGEKGVRHFRAYRFPKEIFSGYGEPDIPKTATVLRVVEANGFKKLVLE